MRDIQTKFVGYAPDQRGRDRPLEIVYLTEQRSWVERARAAIDKSLGFATIILCVVGARVLLQPLIG